MGDFNARIAGLRELPDFEADAELEEATAMSVSTSLLRGIPTRKCKDSARNVFGQALIRLCRELELVILNGRVTGDEGGEITFRHKNMVGKSVIDLFVASPAHFYKTRELKVGSIPTAIGERIGDLLSDHCPVALALDVALGPDAAKKQGRNRTLFDVRRWQQYANLLLANDATAPVQIKEMMSKLGTSFNSTQVVMRLLWQRRRRSGDWLRVMSRG